VPTPGGIRMNDLNPILRNLNEQFNVVGFSVVEYVAENPEQVDKIHNLFENSGITNGFI
jgi:arginase family enzyme